ncbi:DUF2079 domain-containing protein [Desulfurococcus mucosus]|uniref:DUF2079 domain-containing protein n=1 Tax=Desulfurococcus mucosus TaxID=2275 RepID=UPI00064FB059|nr:DUF2079 domain-containing protein [Desulfurococcus mucosus]
MKGILNRLRSVKDHHSYILALAISIYVIIFSALSILKYYGFRAYGMDLGVYAQALWTTLYYGMFFYETPDLFWNSGGSFFGVHFAPLMFALLPIYALYPHPETLLVLQSFIIGLGALPLYWIAKDITNSAEKAVIIALWYLTYAPLHGVNLYDFHLEAFLPTFFLFAYWFFYKKRWIKYLLFAFLITITIDYASLILLFFAIYWLIYYRSDMFSLLIYRKVKHRDILLMTLVTIVLSISMFIIAFKIIDLFGPEPLITSPLWPHLGTRLSEIILGILDPRKVIAALSYDYWYKLAYLMALFSPVLFLNLKSPLPMIMTIPWFAISLLSVNPTFYSLGWQYPANVAPFIFLSVVFYARNTDFQTLRKYLVIGLFVSLLLTPINPLTQSTPAGAAYQPPVLNDHTALLHNIIRLIPSNTTIVTQNNIFPHLVDKGLVYMWVPPGVLPEFVLLDITFPEIYHKYGGKTVVDIVNELLYKADYDVVAMADGIVLYKLRYDEEPVVYVPYHAKFDYRTLIIGIGEKIMLPSLGYVLKYSPATSPEATFFYGPYTVLPPGTYEVIFTLRVEGSLNPGDYIITLDVVANKGKTKFAELPIFYGIDINDTDSWFNVALKFSLDKFYSDIEFRGVKAGNATIYLKDVAIKQLSYKPEPIVSFRFAYDSLAIDKGEVVNRIIMHKSGKGSGVFWHGPYIKLLPGKYRVTVWLKLDKAVTEHTRIIDLDIVYNRGTHVLNKTSLYTKDFIIGKWQPFTLLFNLNETANDVEFRGVNIENNVGLSLLFIEVEYVGEDFAGSSNS